MSFEKHMQSCSTCIEEVAVLVQVRLTMQKAPIQSSTPLEHWRLRAALLRRADEQTVRARGRAAWRMWHWGMVAAVVALALFFMGRVLRERSLASLAPPTFDVENREGAVWTTEIVGATAHVLLSSGSASFHVRRTTDRQRFLLSLPDGEIEVHGTRFVVNLAGGATRHVEVSEGVVTLRLRGAPPRDIHAGDSWDHVSSPAAGLAPAQVHADEDRGDEPGDRAGGQQHLQHMTDRRDAVASPEPFAAGVAAFRAGDFRRAEQLLDRFLLAQGMSGDARIEDACFLRAVARSRSGDIEGASKLAKDYLRRFPNGLRRPEAERIAAEQ